MQTERKRRHGALALTVALTVMSLATATRPAAAVRTYYFAPAPIGVDNSACSETAPCSSLGRASNLPLAPGDCVLFKRSGEWKGVLTISRSGASGSNIIVGAYGSGAQPRFTSPPGGQESCISITGSWVTLDNVETSDCGYAGVRGSGQHLIVKYLTSARNEVGVFITRDARFGRYERNAIADNNRMTVNTSSLDNDDSGAFGFLVHGDDNELKNNVVSGSDAFSHDYERDGCAVEIYGASNTRVHHNTASNNNCFTELGKDPARPSPNNNRFEYNVVYSAERAVESPRAGSQSTALVTRGPADKFGAVTNTVFRNNSIWLHGNGTAEERTEAIVCFGGCTASSLELRANAIRVSGSGSRTGWVPENFANSAYNVFFPMAPVNLVKGRADVVADPQFRSLTDLHVARISPVVDRGCTAYWSDDRDFKPVPVDLADRPDTANCLQHPDAGAYELQF